MDRRSNGHNADVCLKSLFAGRAEFVTRYGSHSEDGDVDALVVSGRCYPMGAILLGQLDLLCVSREQLQEQISLCDPMFLEPVITGRLLVGDPASWVAIREQALQARPDSSTIRYLRRRAESLCTDAVAIMEPWSQQSLVCLVAATTNLSFAASYILVAEHQEASQDQVLMLRDIEKLPNGDLLRRIRQFLQRIKRIQHQTIDDTDKGAFRQLLEACLAVLNG